MFGWPGLAWPGGVAFAGCLVLVADVAEPLERAVFALLAVDVVGVSGWRVACAVERCVAAAVR
jgi:hypothetical protein